MKLILLYFLLQNVHTMHSPLHSKIHMKTGPSIRYRTTKKLVPNCNHIPIGVPMILTNKPDRFRYDILSDSFVCPASNAFSAEDLKDFIEETKISVVDFISSGGCKITMIVGALSAFSLWRLSIPMAALGGQMGRLVGEAGASYGQECLQYETRTVLKYDSKSQNTVPIKEQVCIKYGRRNYELKKGSDVGNRIGQIAGAFFGIRVTMQTVAAMMADPSSLIHVSCLSKECLAGISGLMELATGAMFGKVIQLSGVTDNLNGFNNDNWVKFGVINDIVPAVISATKVLVAPKDNFIYVYGLLASTAIGYFAAKLHGDSSVHRKIGSVGGSCYGIMIMIYFFFSAYLFGK